MAITVFLLLTVVMPPGERDVHMRIEERSMTECWADAAAFVSRGVPAGKKDAQALGAACFSNAPQSFA